MASLLASTLARSAGTERAVFFEQIDGLPAGEADFSHHLEAHGFVRTSRGMLHRRTRQ
jgi:hypothetical protein